MPPWNNLRLRMTRKIHTPIRVVQVGLGPIGQAVARLAARHPALALVGGTDLDPDRIGRDLGEVLGLAPLGAPVESSISALLERARPDLVLHTTGSFLEEVRGQILDCLEGEPRSSRPARSSAIPSIAILSWPTS